MTQRHSVSSLHCLVVLLVELLLDASEPTPIDVLRSQLAYIEPRADFDYALFLALAAGAVEETEPGIVRLR